MVNLKTFDKTMDAVGEENLHLKIGTIHYPPFIFHDEKQNIVYGIEPSLLEILAEKLNFTFQYVFASPNEMWGEILDSGETNVTITGLIGMLHRKEVDIVLGNLYVDYNENKYIDFGQSYGMSHECFMVPVPRPYPKWMALYEPFQWSVWTTMFLSLLFVALTLRLAARLRSASSNFNDVYLCILFVLGHVLGIHQSHQGIRSSSNRFLFIIWLFRTFVIATGYRSIFISYMTTPYIPPPVDTIKQLTQSPMGKITFGNFIRDALLRSNIPILNELGEQISVTFDFTSIYSLIDSDKWAVQSSKESLEYMAATKCNSVYSNCHVHLMLECVLPALIAFGLQKNSPLKNDMDYETQRLIESGIIQHHRSEFARQMNPTTKVNDGIEPLALDHLQGAFYLFFFWIFCLFNLFLD